MERRIDRVLMPARKRIALIAHDSRKDDLLEWARYNREVLREHELVGTGATGALVQARCGLSVTRLKSGPLGGDQQMGAKIADGELDVLVFFWDPLEPHPHEPDVRALLRIAVLYNIPVACNRATADFVIASPLIHGEYDRIVADHGGAREAARTA
jgi:methylglyoxal synthase